MIGPADVGRLIILRAEGPTDPGVLEQVVLRVSDLEGALSSLPDGLRVQRPAPELAVFQGPEGLGLGLTSVPGGGVDYDLDHIVLRVVDPAETTLALAELGFVPRGGALHVADKHLRLEPGLRSVGERPLLSHIGVLVESVEAVEAQARQGGLQTDKRAHPPNTLAVYVRGPEGIRVEYAERARQWKDGVSEVAEYADRRWRICNPGSVSCWRV